MRKTFPATMLALAMGGGGCAEEDVEGGGSSPAADGGSSAGSDSGNAAVGVKIITNNPPTIDKADVDKWKVWTCQQATITVVASDPEGDPLTFTWEEVATPAGEAGADYQFEESVKGGTATATFRGRMPGEYKFLLTIEDSFGNKAGQEFLITVVAKSGQEGKEVFCFIVEATINFTPIIDSVDVATGIKIGTCEEATITITAHDPEGGPVFFGWAVLSLSGVEAKFDLQHQSQEGVDVAKFKAATVGEYHLTVTVQDEKKAETDYTIPFTVFAGDKKCDLSSSDGEG